ncbi:histone-lysine N-methyltransferase PRDM9 [Caerostris extrusa]|uniref:Histone-lysine N-methyltransferase PRDM9 n=1 Tax=Caerostris extrusa TaxID=172846 RepID=A0AAV4MWI5_CAEEX|nr:histone-lysine N-methyltransferase PRDM9 [Caerostris extrusa]
MAFQSIPLGLYPPGRNFEQQEQKPPINNNQNVPVPPPQPPPPPINGEKSPITALICDQCGKTFADKNSFHQHAQFHSKPFACKVCKKTFNSQGTLTQHMRIHTGAPLHLSTLR